MSGALASFGMNIVKAEAFANAQGWCLTSSDSSIPLRSLELNPTESIGFAVPSNESSLAQKSSTVLLKRRRAGAAPQSRR